MQNKIFILIVILCITAMLAVPIFAKPGKQAQNNPKFSSFDIVEYNDSKETGKGKSKQSSVKHNIKMKNLFSSADTGAETDTPTNDSGIKLEKSGKKMKAHVPKGWETKKQAHIKLKDISGEEIAELITEFEDELTDSEMKRMEKGQASLRSIKSLRLVSIEKEVDVSDSKGNKHKIKAHVDVNLNSINEDSSLDITTNNELEEDVDAAFDELAENEKIKLNNRGGVIKVDKINLQNGEEVENATITFKVEPEWVGEDNINDVQILRYDEGYSEVLPTEFAGIDEEGMLVFEGESENGLSTFAVFMTENITATEDTSFDLGKFKAFILPLLILVTVGAAFASSFTRKENK
jgi:PGF-pre-PGF domain-containing protein